MATYAYVETGNEYSQNISFAFWALFLLGFAGIHRLYLGKYGTGILWFFTFGLFGVGQVVDLFRMKTLVHDANIREGYLPHPRAVARQIARAQTPPAPLPPVPTRSPMHRLLDAAVQHNGTLTVTQGVADTGLSFEEVEATLRDMVARGYVDVDNAPDTGVVLYRFVELA